MIEYLVPLSHCSAFRLKHFIELCKKRRSLTDSNQLADFFWDEPILQRQIYETMRTQKIYNEIEEILKKEINILYPGHPHYPLEFFALEKPPLVLYVLGTLPKTTIKLGVVGSREISEETEIWLRRHLSEVLNDQCIATISGGARGVDRLVHDLSSFYRRPTVVFLPAGLGKTYPRDLAKDLPRYLDQNGAVVSEYPIHSEMRKHHFLQRNRMIAAYSSHLLIAQAQIKGGTMTTADWAMRCGTELAVVPQSPLYSNFEGNLQLLVDGAAPVRDSIDLNLFIQKKAGHGVASESTPDFP